jgi:AGZA family xanthine/uracil permease-like MFS transporter
MSSLADAKPVPAPTDGFLERTFALTARGTSVGTEVRAGLTTFMVMSYWGSGRTSRSRSRPAWASTP